MGMYTEICCRIRFKDDLDNHTLGVLKYMVGDGETPVSLPQHDLFKTDRWDFMLKCNSFYHIPKTTMELFYNDISNCWYLVGRSDLKNYDSEIELFFDWIKPYCEFRDEFIGYSIYEEDNEPVIYKS